MTERSSGGGTKQGLHNDWQSRLVTAHQQGPTSGNSASIADFQRKENSTASGRGIKFHGIWPVVGAQKTLDFPLPLRNIRKVMLQSFFFVVVVVSLNPIIPLKTFNIASSS